MTSALAPKCCSLEEQGRVQSSPMSWKTKEQNFSALSNTEYLVQIPELVSVFSSEKKINFSIK